MALCGSRRRLARGLCWLSFALCGIGASRVHASPVSAKDIDLSRLSRDADFVFSGKVVDVSYRRSEPQGSGGFGPQHTFVTYEVERVWKGRTDQARVTLRFFGGPTTSTRFVRNEGAPLFDKDDRDVLFVRDNGSAECPLVQCADGRLRLIDGKVYSDAGNRIERGAGDVLRRGGFEQLEAVMTHHMSDTIKLRFVETDPPVQTSNEAQLRENELAEKLATLPIRSSALLRSADIREPFQSWRKPTAARLAVAQHAQAYSHPAAQPAPAARGSADRWFWLWPLAAALALLTRYRHHRAQALKNACITGRSP